MPTNHEPSLWESFFLWSVSDRIAFVNCILTGLFLLATIVSVLCAFIAYRHQKLRAQKEAACDLAKCYSEDILQHYLFVTDVLEDSGLGDKAKELFPYDELTEFTQEEMNSFLEKKNVSYEEIEHEFEYLDPKSILTAKRMHRPSEQEREDMLQSYDEFLRKVGDNKQLAISLLQHEFSNNMWEYLNALEWFSMCCRYGIADEEILYQSLHQSFLSSVGQLYFYICRKNIANENKYYTNIIWLFGAWQKRMKAIQKKAEHKQANAQKEIENAERRKNAAEKKKRDAKPKVHSGSRLR